MEDASWGSLRPNYGVLDLLLEFSHDVDMMVSPSASYALRALIYLARQGGRAPVTGRAISGSEGMPAPFLAKILLSLRRRGLVTTRRGPGGGYMLARPPAELRVRDVIEAMRGAEVPGDCLLGLHECSEGSACVMHGRFTRFREQVAAAIESMSLADVVAMDAACPARKRPGGGGGARSQRPS